MCAVIASARVEVRCKGAATSAPQRRAPSGRVATGFATGSAEMPVQVRVTRSISRYCELVHHNTGQSWATLDGRRATSSQGGGTGSNPVGAANKTWLAIVFCGLLTSSQMCLLLDSPRVRHRMGATSGNQTAATWSVWRQSRREWRLTQPQVSTRAGAHHGIGST